MAWRVGKRCKKEGRWEREEMEGRVRKEAESAIEQCLADARKFMAILGRTFYFLFNEFVLVYMRRKKYLSHNNTMNFSNVCMKINLHGIHVIGRRV